MKVTVVQRLADIPAAEWNGLQGTDNPFLRHEFLAALESHDCVSPENGWQSFHLLLIDGGRLRAAAPAYIKGHSWGEFVFDWSWADAHARRGLPYYPKLVVAVPYSPVPGPRLLIADEADPVIAAKALGQAATQIADEYELSSAHWLFTEDALTGQLQDNGYLHRMGYQFHWTNNGYQDFDHYLSTFASKKRKNVRQERERVRAAGIQFQWLPGDAVDDAQWRIFERFYRITFHEHGNVPVMSAGFFRDIGRRLGDRVLLLLAFHRGEAVAGALFLRSSDTLYGRYWGSIVELSGLHFETCYYQGIDYCIRHGLQRFEPGAQGEHKVARGFLPVATHSVHWLRDDMLRGAVAGFLDRERQQVDAYMADVRRHSPFRAQQDT